MDDLYTTTEIYDLTTTRDIPLGNDSINVLIKGCLSNYDTLACARNIVLSAIAVVTGILCVLKILKLHWNRHPMLHQYIIFYCAVIECLVCALDWTLVIYLQLSFISLYLKLVQFLVVSHFYWTIATRAIRKENLNTLIATPLLGGTFAYFTIVTIFAVVLIKPSWVECFEPYWLALSTVEAVLVQIFAAAGVLITRRLNEISTLASVRKQQKRDLWSLIIVFELSAIVGFTYDLTLRALGDDENGCSGVFLHLQEVYSTVFCLFMIMKLLLPIWTMLLVFNPVEELPDAGDCQPFASDIQEEGSYTSVFIPQNRHQYRRIYQPQGGSYDTYQSPSSTPSVGSAVQAQQSPSGSSIN